MRYLRTSELARAVGVHPNTVRRYVERDLLPPITRTPAGYRRFTQRHLECLRVACQVYRAQFPGMALHLSGRRIVAATVGGDLVGARALAGHHLALVRAERAQADLAADLLERWAFGPPAEETSPPLRIGQAARVLGVTTDIVRSWDRNGLIDIPRDPDNGYRRYGAAEMSRLRVIRMLSRAGYSLAAILRMLLQLDRGELSDPRHALDTPRPDEDAHLASDRWLSTLADQECRAHTIVALLDEMLHVPSRASLVGERNQAIAHQRDDEPSEGHEVARVNHDASSIQVQRCHTVQAKDGEAEDTGTE